MLNILKKKLNYTIDEDWIAIEEAFHNADFNLVVWRRGINPNIVRLIKFLYTTNFRKLQQKINIGTIEEDLTFTLKSNLPTSPFISYEDLKDDLCLLCYHFLQLTGKENVDMHLRIVTDNACSKFHVDGYESRLLCTYDGAGTQWLSDDNVRRHFLGKTNSDIVKNESKIMQMQPFEVGLLKGENFKNPSNKGIVHRSPPIESSGGKRFVIRLDA
ncbi:hypothetical protein GCM10011506_01380 [Marivirga lumbricoides]|nr:hypothetical protein GCM10011506_01380 [Marivirga lumbricoides]